MDIDNFVINTKTIHSALCDAACVDQKHKDFWKQLINFQNTIPQRASYYNNGIHVTSVVKHFPAETKLSFIQHTKLKNLSNKCKLKLTKEQYDMFMNIQRDTNLLVNPFDLELAQIALAKRKNQSCFSKCVIL